MTDLLNAVDLIRKYEGFNEKAYPDPVSGAAPYTIGYGTQFYPDGSAVRKGHLCSTEKAMEYLLRELEILDTQLKGLELNIDECMHQALLSFVHSVGWEPFLYSEIIDAIEREEFSLAADEMERWIFDEDGKVIGNLLERRREEVKLFLKNVLGPTGPTGALLLAAFRNYAGAKHQVQAIKNLEQHINPYILSQFANAFKVNDYSWATCQGEEFDSLFNC